MFDFKTISASLKSEYIIGLDVDTTGLLYTVSSTGILYVINPWFVHISGNDSNYLSLFHEIFQRIQLAPFTPKMFGSTLPQMLYLFCNKVLPSLVLKNIYELVSQTLVCGLGTDCKHLMSEFGASYYIL